MEYKLKILALIFSLTVVVLLSSCGERLFGLLPETCAPFEFTLPVSIEIEGDRDTISVGDTFMISHEMPFRLKENKNGTYYDIGPVLYDPELSIYRITKLNTLCSSNPNAFEFVPIPNGGEIVFQQLSNGNTIRNVNMKQDSVGYSFKNQVIPKKEGEYILFFQYLEHRLEDSDPNFLKDTCGNQDIRFDYEVNSGINNTVYKLGTDSIWSECGIIDFNLLELHKRVDMFVLTVQE